MTREHPNARLLREFFAALERRDATGALSLLSDDVVWRFPGRRSVLAGEHRGREQVVRFLAAVMSLTEGTFRAEIKDIAASDDHAVVLFTGHAERRGKTLMNPTALCVRIRDGSLAAFDEFVWDLDHVEDFWS